MSGPLVPDDDDDTGKLFFTSGADGNTEITVNMLPVLVAVMAFLMCKFPTSRHLNWSQQSE